MNDIKNILLDLVKIPSISNSDGEIRIAEFIYSFISKIPYFIQHPDKLKKLMLDDGRFTVLAIIDGKKDDNKKAVITIGHIDTVGIEDYGPLKEFAFDSETLKKELEKIVLNEEVRADLESGSYLFGRGIFDMKAGDAILLDHLIRQASNVEELSGSIIYAFVPDEESNSLGMLKLVKYLAEDDHDHRALIDLDYMTSRFKGDKGRYVYIGSVGKLMPFFYAFGKECHVGEIYRGLDPNLFIAKIVSKMSMNPLFADKDGDEVTVAPACLYMRDQKAFYSVQTALSSACYFNYSTYKSDPSVVLAQMKKLAENSVKEVMAGLKDVVDNEYTLNVLSFDELFEEVNKIDPSFREKYFTYLNNQNKDIDIRQRALNMVGFVYDHFSVREPLIVTGFLPPYYPHVYVDGDDDKSKELLSVLQNVLNEYEDISLSKYYPYISDLSYVSAPLNVDDLMINMPGFGVLYDLPFDAMKKLDLPVCNIGPYGKDAHKYTERLDEKYSFEIVPLILNRVISDLLRVL